MSATGVSKSILPRSIRIMAATEPIALVMEKIRKTVSSPGGPPGRRLARRTAEACAVGVGNHADRKGHVPARHRPVPEPS